MGKLANYIRSGLRIALVLKFPNHPHCLSRWLVLVLKFKMSQLALQTETREQGEMRTGPNLSSIHPAERPQPLRAMQDTQLDTTGDTNQGKSHNSFKLCIQSKQTEDLVMIQPISSLLTMPFEARVLEALVLPCYLYNFWCPAGDSSKDPGFLTVRAQRFLKVRSF